MRVLHIGAGNMFGGVETILVTLARFRDLCPEMQPEFAMSFAGRLSRELTEAGVPVHALGPVRSSRYWTVLRGRKELRQLFKQRSFDAVICHMSWAQAIFGPVAREFNIPLIFYVHNRTAGRGWLDRWARWAVKPDLVICVSKDTAQASATMYPGVPTTVMYSPCPVTENKALKSERSAVRLSMGTSDDATVIIQVSRMESWKGHSALLEALGRLRGSQEWECWVVGGSQTPAERAYLEEIENLSTRLGLAGRVRFLGERRDVPRLLAAADVFCQPNRASEGFSIVFMEAFLAGLPIVTSAIGGGLEMVDASCGVLLPPDDVEGLTRALQVLIQDKEGRVRMGAAGREKLLRMCDPKTQLYELLGLLRQASANKGLHKTG